jgi:glutamate dehydrogenase
LPGWSLSDAENLDVLCRLGHQVMIRREGPNVAYRRVLEIAEREPDLARRFVELLSAKDGAVERSEMVAAIDDGVDGEEARRVLRTLLDVVASCRATNATRSERYATSVEIDPALLHAEGQEDPHGVVFVHGRGFDGFHVRFRDIARGGVRIVRPRSDEQHTLENERLYAEAHGLAAAQQLKNKDIPEGGSKGVILLEPHADADASGRAYADALLDLLVRPGADDGPWIYLGPDENVSDALICWIVDRAERRGYPMPNAFMSSKPGTGINHKQYGVTSEGVTVFLNVALGHIGIRRGEGTFTVKLTGGPDGDVAGNEIRILHRDYGEAARIVGIADGSGSAEDPAGLDHDELLRLVAASLPIAAFDRAYLGPEGRVLAADEPGGLRARNTLHDRVVSDVFVPAGGRPRTIHDGNWEEFLTADGRPSSRVIVEGANLFLTPEARSRLSERGVIIIKDSSANKGGVICSSFEVLASMVWSEERFLELKPRFVADVIDKLRELARLEAELLFDEHEHRPALSFPELSTRLSHAIIRAADALTEGIGRLGDDSRELIRHLAASHFPTILVEDLGDRLFDRLPRSYIDSAVATALASRIVYREGLAYLEDMPPEGLVDLALRYLREELNVSRLARDVAGSELPEARRIADLLREGGVRASLRHRPD